jgi:hypothetical protein
MLPTQESDQFSSEPQAPKRLRQDPEITDTGLRMEVEALKSLVESLREEVLLLRTELKQNPKPTPKSFKDALNPPSLPQTDKSSSKAKNSAEKSKSKISTSSSKISVDPPPKISVDPPPKISKSTPEPEWTQVQSKKLSKSSKVLATPSLKSVLEKATTPAEKLKLLLRSPKLVDRSEEVSPLMVNLPLSRKAQSQPMMAWKQVMESVTGHCPVSVSLIHPWKGEVFYDSKLVPVVSKALREAGYLIENFQISDKDLNRRSAAYLNGHYLPLRRAAWQGFSAEKQLQLLNLAENQILKKFSDSIDRKKWKYQIELDRRFLQEMEI